MKETTKILAAAVMSLTLSAGAFGQASGGSSAGGTGASSGGGGANNTSSSGSGIGSTSGGGSTGSSATGGAAGSGSADRTGSGASTGADAMGAADTSTARDMVRGAMGGSDADRQIQQQLSKIQQSPDKAADQLFVLEAAMGNMWEVEFSRVAQQKAQDSQIKELAEMMVKDHSQANQQLQQVAQKLNVELPKSLPSHKQQMLAVFQAMPTEQFETCYVVDLKKDHAKDITSYADHQKSVKDEDLRKYVSATLPKLQQHGEHVMQVASAKGFGTEMASGVKSGGSHGSHSDHKDSDKDAKK